MTDLDDSLADPAAVVEPMKVRGHCGPCLVAWTTGDDTCPECGEPSTEALRAALVVRLRAAARTGRPGDPVLRLLICGAGLSQSAVAEQVGMSEKHLSQVVTGKAAMSADLAVRLGAVLGVAPELLLIEQSIRAVRR
jgi:addiction module HigA family antidote